MIFGYNTEISYKKRKYHIQTEDRGVKHPVIETLVYNKGEIVFSTKQNYGHLLEHEDVEKKVKKILEEQHNEVISNIKEGKYDTLFGIEETQEIKLERKLEEETLGEKQKKELDKKTENNILDIIKIHVNHLTDKEIFYNIHFPIIDFNDERKVITIAGKITIYRTKKPLINTPVEIILKDKKQKMISTVDVKTNYYGGFRTEVLVNSKPYWANIIINKGKDDKISALFYTR
jgi:hypothetical protein